MTVRSECHVRLCWFLQMLEIEMVYDKWKVEVSASVIQCDAMHVHGGGGGGA